MGTPALPWGQDVEDDGANDALLDALFTFLEDESTGPTAAPADATPYTCSVDASPEVSALPLPAKRKRPSATKKGCLVQHTLDALRDEAEQLTETLQRLRMEASQSYRSSATEAALTERYKRRRAEKECEQLRDAVYAQAQFLKGLQSVFLPLPSFASGLNLCRHLHNYTRLPRERSVRWSEYAALSQEARLQRALDILCRETQALTCNERGGFDTTKPLLSSTVDAPFVRSDLINEADSFGVTSTCVYALETRDIGAAARGVCVAVRDIMRCTSHECTNLKGQIVDPDVSSSAANNILYRVMGIHHKSLPATSDELSVESRVLTLYKQTDDQAVVFWDYIDEDELHPTTDVDFTRQAIGVCLVRREMCDDGVERTVCRLLHTRRYKFHERVSADKLHRVQVLLNTSSWENQHLWLGNNRENELLFRGLLLDSIAKEESAYARAVGTARSETC